VAKPTRDERLQRVHSEARRRFNDIQSAVYAERKQCLEDRRFYSISGAQWEGNLSQQFENKPQFEVNKIHLAVVRIFNEYRNNRITARFVTKDGKPNDALADLCNGLFRADEQDSYAEEAYDNAFEEAVGGGIGAWRLRSVYENDEDPDNEQQRIRIEPVFDADSCVYFDLDAKRQDKADAKYCFVLTMMTPEAYTALFDDDPATWPKDVEASQFDWYTPDTVVVAEYYLIEETHDESIVYANQVGDEKKFLKSVLDETMTQELLAKGFIEDRRKRVTIKKVHKYTMSGGRVLEDNGYVAGKCIPIIPVYGKRWVVDNVERCMGHVRLAKDAQRLKNMQLSKLGEISSLSAVEKPILLPEQVAGHGNMWAEDNIKNYPYLLINPITDATGNPMPAAPIAYTKPPQVPPALAALLQLTESDIQDILGNQQEADKIVANVSEKALNLVQTRMDMQTYIYVSNFAKAVRRCGEVWLSMAKDIYVEPERTMKTINESGSANAAKLKIPAKDQASGALILGNDLTKANFDVAVTVGPSSTSRREATLRSITDLLQITQDPETMQVLLAMAVMNMEGEGMHNLHEYFRKKLVQIGVEEPTDADMQAATAQAQAQKPTAQEEALLAMAQESQAKATKARADVLETVANTELTHAKTLETLANIDPAERARVEAQKLVPQASALVQ